MSLRIIEISAPDKASDKIHELAEENKAIDYWYNAKNKDGRRTTRILVDVQNQQDMLDDLQRWVSDQDDWRIALIPVEATLPKPDKKEEEKKQRNPLSASVTREELHDSVENGALITFDFLLLVFLSTIVAAIGLMRDDTAVVIGAMVIAPLLGPNLALAFGAALGNRSLMFNAMKANGVGLGMTLLISILIGAFFSTEELFGQSNELMARTDVSYAAIALALAAGGAAVLSLTAGVSSALVGVMVAVALMPPAVAMGVCLGAGQITAAYGAGLLLATNVICINLAAQGVFLLKGLRPRTWYEERQARASARINAGIWFGLLLLLMGLIWLKQHMDFF